MPVLRQEEDGISRSVLDKRKYRHLTLNNELQALLVSDATTEKAAASLAVRVGYLCDPEEIPGLAHFCEHMLFLGTEKYPSENAYREFLSQHAGSCNATTSAEFTTFFFDVGWEHLVGALDRFAQFFLSPLFNASATDREVKAVDSENNRNLQEDAWRIQQVLKELSKEGHPHRKFQTGNSYTLGSHPLELGVDIREELTKFHSVHYSSNLMRLAVIGRESLDELTALVEGLFSPVQNKSIRIPDFPDHPYSPDELQLWIECVPVKELRQIRIEFPIPDMHQYYCCDPLLYVAHLIGHEGQGSLFAHLKAKGWCNSLEAGPASGAKGYDFFVIKMVLSSEGEDHVGEMVEAVFQYLALIRKAGPQKTLFQECADINAMEFLFQDKQKPRTYALLLSKCLHEFPTADVLSGPYLQKEFRPALIELLLSHLTPQRVRVCAVGKRFEGKTEHTEKWYGTQYHYRKIAPETISQWESVSDTEQLHLPAVNEFIPTDFELVPIPDGAPKVPVLVQESEMSKVWYKQDNTFSLPKACLCFLLSTPLAYRDPTSALLTSLFTNLLVDALNEYAYNAEIAGIQYKIKISFYGLIMIISGYRHKQSILLSRIMEKMTQFEVDHRRFAIHKETLARQLKNFHANQPYSHAIYYTGALLVQPCWTNMELESAVGGVSAEQLQLFIPQLLSAIHVEALVIGNISKEESLRDVSLVEDMLGHYSGTKPLPASAISRLRTVQLPDGSSHLFTVPNSVHNSCSLEVYLQAGQEDTRSNMLLELTHQIISEPCFDILRTKEQLGYIVSSGLRRSNGVQGLRIVVQSDKDVMQVEQRTEAFLLTMQSHLDGLAEEEFSTHKKALELKRLEKPKTLGEECQKYWTEITTGMYCFNRDEEEVAALREITKEDVIAFFKDCFSLEGCRRSKLVVHVVPTKKTVVAEDETVEEGGREEKGESGEVEEKGEDGAKEDTDSRGLVLPKASVISDIGSFKTKLPLFPAVTPYIPTSL